LTHTLLPPLPSSISPFCIVLNTRIWKTFLLLSFFYANSLVDGLNFFFFGGMGEETFGICAQFKNAQLKQKSEQKS